MKKSKTAAKTVKSKAKKTAKVTKAKSNVISIAELYALKKQREQEKAAANAKGWDSAEEKGPVREQYRAVGGGRRSGFGGSRHH